LFSHSFFSSASNFEAISLDNAFASAAHFESVGTSIKKFEAFLESLFAQAA
jgi:hypothetical protein